LRRFFFSSRRRHTRFSRDWSSDVCSSDLHHPGSVCPEGGRGRCAQRARSFSQAAENALAVSAACCFSYFLRIEKLAMCSNPLIKIGRASCRERVEVQDVVGCIQKQSVGDE